MSLTVRQRRRRKDRRGKRKAEAHQSAERRKLWKSPKR